MGAHDGWHDGIDNFPGFRDWRQLCGASPASRFQCPGHGLNGRSGQTPGCFRVNVGVDPVAFGQWILSIRSLNMVSRCHVFAKDIPIRNHSRISCQPSGSSLHQSRVTRLEVEFGLGGVEQCPVELVIFCWYVDWIGISESRSCESKICLMVGISLSNS